jgi:hypothetical protein
MTTLTELFPVFSVGEPDVTGALAVFPVTAAMPRLEYVSFAEGAGRGVTVTELPGGASVNDLLVTNPLDVGVLLYEGEELLGAQQNRTVDAAVLVGAGMKVSVPVSCVEHNRWDGRRHAEPMAPSPQTAHPNLRRAKSLRMREALAAGAPARANQQEVWAMTGAGAMSDTFDAARGSLDALASGVTRRPGQTGALAAIGGRFVVFDHVSRADAFAALFGPLTQGYALDARGRVEAAVPSVDDAVEWLARAADSRVTLSPTVGVGSRVSVAGEGGGGTGLAVDDELIQLSVYADETATTRIARPSRRR